MSRNPFSYYPTKHSIEYYCGRANYLSSCLCEQCKEERRKQLEHWERQMKSRIVNRVKVGQTSIKYPANSLVHQSLKTLSIARSMAKNTATKSSVIPESQLVSTDIRPPLVKAAGFGLGTCAYSYVCQTMELCGWVKRSVIPITQMEDRRIRINKPIKSKKEKRFQKIIGSTPKAIYDYKDTPVTRNIVMYEITDVGLEALKKFDEINNNPTGPSPHPTRTHAGRIKGYKQVEVPIYVDPEVVDRFDGAVW